MPTSWTIVSNDLQYLQKFLRFEIHVISYGISLSDFYLYRWLNTSIFFLRLYDLIKCVEPLKFFDVGANFNSIGADVEDVHWCFKLIGSVKTWKGRRQQILRSDSVQCCLVRLGWLSVYSFHAYSIIRLFLGNPLEPN